MDTDAAPEETIETQALPVEETPRAQTPPPEPSSAPSSASSSEPPPPVEKLRNAPWYSRRGPQLGLRLAGGFALLMATICIYISRMPQIFDVNQVARQAAIDRGHISPDSTRRLPTGYTTVYSVIHLTNWMLDKPGGYLYNDRLFLPRYFIDNMPNFEYGMVVQLRDMVLSLRQEFSRSRAQSVERDDLIRAHGFFSFDHNRWLVPSTESQYRAGVRLLEEYLESLTKTGPDAGQFVARQDVLEGWLRQQQRRLGTFGVRLRQNAGVYEFNPMIDTTDDEFADLPGFDFLNQRITPWHKRDDVFYEIRGSVFVLYHTMLAIRTDFEPMLNDFQAMGIMNRILSELHTASQPMISPVVLNGREYGFLHNHSLTMAAHIAKAHLAIQDLRVLLRGGGDL